MPETTNRSTPDPLLDITVEERDGVVRLRLAGELDMSTTPALEEALHEACAKRGEVVLDFRELRFIDSAGIRVIVLAVERAYGDATRVLLVPGPERVMRVFELVGLADRLPFVEPQG